MAKEEKTNTVLTEFLERLNEYWHDSFKTTLLLRVLYSHAEKFGAMMIGCEEDRQLADALGEIRAMLDEVILPRMEDLNDGLENLRYGRPRAKKEEPQPAAKQN